MEAKKEARRRNNGIKSLRQEAATELTKQMRRNSRTVPAVFRASGSGCCSRLSSHDRRLHKDDCWKAETTGETRQEAPFLESEKKIGNRPKPHCRKKNSIKTRKVHQKSKQSAKMPIFVRVLQRNKHRLGRRKTRMMNINQCITCMLKGTAFPVEWDFR